MSLDRTGGGLHLMLRDVGGGPTDSAVTGAIG